MVDPDKYYVVVTHRAVSESGMSMQQIRAAMCSRQTVTVDSGELFARQPMTVESDGTVAYKVTYTDQPAPDGKKKMAFVVAAKPLSGIAAANIGSFPVDQSVANNKRRRPRIGM